MAMRRQGRRVVGSSTRGMGTVVLEWRWWQRLKRRALSGKVEDTRDMIWRYFCKKTVIFVSIIAPPQNQIFSLGYISKVYRVFHKIYNGIKAVEGLLRDFLEY